MARYPAFAGSSERYSGPSSTEKPSAQKCRCRSTGGSRRGICAVGSSITWLGASSPPRVRAVPVKREVGALGSSPPGLPTSLIMLYQRQVHFYGKKPTYFLALSRILRFKSSGVCLSGFCTAKADFSPPANRSCFSSSSPSSS